MAKVPADDAVSRRHTGPDRRRHNFVGRFQRLVISCTITDVAKAQDMNHRRVAVQPILKACKEQVGKK
jgi:hypothetical protein